MSTANDKTRDEWDIRYEVEPERYEFDAEPAYHFEIKK